MKPEKPDMKFETALKRLEEIVNSLEDGTLALDEALKRYEEGVKLARFCAKQLSETEKKIEILTKSLNGELEAVPFETSEDISGVPKVDAVKSRKTGSREGSRSALSRKSQETDFDSPAGEKSLF